MIKSQLIFALFGICFAFGARASVLLPFQEQEARLLQRAESGDARAAFELAGFYERAQQKDYPKIVLWLRRSATKGNLEAQFALGKIYHFGKPNVLKDVQQAAFWYEKAAAQGDKQAVKFLDILRKTPAYKLESAPNIDEKWDMQWTAKTASYGDKVSQFELGRLYQEGKKIQMDYEQAAKWYEKAAVQGHIESMFALAGLYLSGKGVNADIEKSLFWYEQAALRDYAPAQRKLFEIYSSGVHRVPDLTKAAGWLYVSLMPLFPDEKELTRVSPELEKLFLEMTLGQKEEALYFAYSYRDTQRK